MPLYPRSKTANIYKLSVANIKLTQSTNTNNTNSTSNIIFSTDNKITVADKKRPEVWLLLSELKAELAQLKQSIRNGVVAKPVNSL